MTKLNKWLAILICTTILASLLSACAHPATGGSSSVPDSTSSTPVSSVETTSSEPSVSSQPVSSVPVSSGTVSSQEENTSSKPTVFDPPSTPLTYKEYFSEERFSREGLEHVQYPEEPRFFTEVLNTHAWYHVPRQVFYRKDGQEFLLYNYSRWGLVDCSPSQLVAVEGSCIVRYDYEMNRSVIYTGEKQLRFVNEVSAYILLFHDGEMAYRMFLPTGQVDPLGEVDSIYTDISCITNTDFLFETPDEGYIAHADAGGVDVTYDGTPLYWKVYSTQTNKFYPYDPADRIPGIIYASGNAEIMYSYIDQRAADLEKMENQSGIVTKPKEKEDLLYKEGETTW